MRRRVARVDELRRVGERRLVEQVGELRARGLRREKEETSGFGDEESGRASELRIPERWSQADKKTVGSFLLVTISNCPSGGFGAPGGAFGGPGCGFGI